MVELVLSKLHDEFLDANCSNIILCMKTVREGGSEQVSTKVK